MAKRTAMDDINDALGIADAGGEDPNRGVVNDDDPGTPVDEGTGGDDDPLLEGLDEEGEEEEGEPRVANEGDDAEEGEEAVDADGNVLHRDPVTGKFIKAPEETPAEKVAREAAAAGAKKPDPLNDPIDKTLAQPTQERIRSLIATTKEVTRERDEARQNYDFMVGGIQATGTTVEQYSEVLSFMALFNSGDPAQQGQALDLLEDVTERLAALLGKERRSTDVLEQHKDLQAEVLAKTLSPERAKEIARNRNQATFRGQLNSSAQQQQQQRNQQQQAYAKAKTDLSTMEKTLMATDKNYEAKRKQLLPILKAVFQTIPYERWPTAFENAYKNMQFIVPGARPNRHRTDTTRNPVRPNRNPGGTSKAKISDLDVLNGALDDFAERVR